MRTLKLLLLSACIFALGCGADRNETPTAAPSEAPSEVESTSTGDPVPDDPPAPATQLFLYEASLEAPPCAVSAEPRTMRVRGYRLRFAGAGDASGGSTASLVAIRGDGTVPGVVYEVNEACLADLDEQQRSRGYERAQIHVEEIAPGRGGPTTAATAYVLTSADGATAGSPDEAYVARMRAAWEEHGLDTGALDHALEQP